MGYIIHFIGIVMIVKASTTTKVPANIALMPLGRAGQTFCAGKVKIVDDHAAFVRVDDSQINDQSGWTDHKPCDAPDKCTVFRIPDGSDLEIDSGFTSTGGLVREDSSCLIPGTYEVSPKLTVDLISNPVTATVAAFKLPDGRLSADQLPNEMIRSTLSVTAPTGAPVKDIRITAKPRAGGTVRTLAVKAGTEINIMNVPVGQETMHPGTKHVAMPMQNAHFFIFNNLLDTELCKLPPSVRLNCSETQAITGNVNTDFACSNTGCCKP